MISKLKRALWFYSWLEDNIVAVALGVSALMGFVGVILRFVIRITIWEIFPVQQYCFLFSVLLGAGIASRKGIHVRVEIIDTLLGKRPRARLVIRSLMLFVAFASFCAFTYLSYDFMVWAWEVKQVDTILTWFNLGVVKTLPFILGLVSSVALGSRTVKCLSELRKVHANRGKET